MTWHITIRRTIVMAVMAGTALVMLAVAAFANHDDDHDRVEAFNDPVWALVDSGSFGGTPDLTWAFADAGSLDSIARSSGGSGSIVK